MARILITRAPHQTSALAEALRALGHDPILIPAIELAPPTTYAELDAAIATLRQQGIDTPHWLLFTSANAVEAFAARLTHHSSVILSEVSAHSADTQPKDPPPIPHPAQSPAPFSPESSGPPPTLATSYFLLPIPCRIAAIGPATARAIATLLGTEAALTPPQAVAESLAEALLPHALQPDGSPTRFLLIRAETARDVLPETLRSAGAHVTIAPAYRTVIPTDSLPKIRSLFHSPSTYPDAITFTSSSTATNLLALLEAAGLTLPPEIPRISIGPVTSQTLRDLNLPPHAEAAEPTIPSLVEILVKSLAAPPRC
jgi:uroporphyrinogen-III synthase